MRGECGMSDPFRFTTIAHHGRAILGPLGSGSVDALLAKAAPPAFAGRRAAVLDVGCGKGEILLRAMRRLGATGTGVDPNPSFIGDARERARGRVAAADLTLILGRLAASPVPRGVFDLVICTGATHAFGGWAQALNGLAALVRAGGRGLVGVGYWKRPPDPEYLECFGGREDDLLPLEPTLDATRAAGWAPLAHHASTPEEWDEYEGGYESAVRSWLAARPRDPDVPAFRERIDAWAGAYRRWGRETMGFVTVAVRR